MKTAKKKLSILLVLAIVFSLLSLYATAEPAAADYSALDAAIGEKLPNEANLYFYTDEAIDLVTDVLENVIDRDLTADDQDVVDSYVDLVEELAALINIKVNDGSQSPLSFNGDDYPYAYPYGDDGYDFYPFRAEEKAEHTIDLSADKGLLPLVSRVAGDQSFTFKLAIGSNSLLCAGGIPLLYDKTKLEVVGVDNDEINAEFSPTTVGDNLAQYFDFTAVLNPDSPNFWPEVYRNDDDFKAQWGAINILMTSNFDDFDNLSVMPEGLEEVINIEFKVKEEAEEGFARIYIDPAFGRSAAEKANSLYLGRGKDAGSFSYYDQLAAYGATLDVEADVTVEIFKAILGDTNLDGNVNTVDVLLLMQFLKGATTFNEKQIYQGDVNLVVGGPGVLNTLDALVIRQYLLGAITGF